MQALSFEILRRSSTNHARLGRVTTPHGVFQTPAFMPVATAAAMKGILPSQVAASGAEIILNNAYHLLVRVGVERMRAVGGSHRFMRWPGPILTDSGGFQAYSMKDITKVDDDGVTFRSFVDGSKIRLGPRESMAIQNAIGADIIMAFDDCPPAEPEDPAPDPASDPASDLASDLAPGPGSVPAPDQAERTRAKRREKHRRRVLEAHERTLRWLEACVRHHERPDEQALFGIVQGGTDLDLRRRSLEGVCSIDLPGYAIGGVAVGEGTDEIDRVVAFTAPLLPDAKPRYLMGVGYERDIAMAVASGIDMFDCVLPTRNGRNGFAFTRQGPIRLRNACHAEDLRPLDPTCDCVACAGDPVAVGARPGGERGYSRAYLRHLFMADEMLGPMLVTLHNLRHYQRLMLDIRQAIHDDAWSSLLAAWPVLARTPVGVPRDDDAERG
jgi:queuine tRNA-ribosyltransferase